MRVTDLFSAKSMLVVEADPEFTMSFKLEALVDTKRMRLSPMTLDALVNNGSAVELEKRLELLVNFGGDLHVVKHGDRTLVPFTYASDEFDFTPEALQTLTKTFVTMRDAGVHTNRSCRFRASFGFPEADRIDFLWTKLQYAFDDQAIAHFAEIDAGLTKSQTLDPLSIRKRASALFKELKGEDIPPSQTIRDLHDLFEEDFFGGVFGHYVNWRSSPDFLDPKNAREVVLFLTGVREYISWLIAARHKPEIVINRKTGLLLSRSEFAAFIEADGF
jgi:hypothetical protein